MNIQNLLLIFILVIGTMKAGSTCMHSSYGTARHMTSLLNPPRYGVDYNQYINELREHGFATVVE